jgi:hypothetical protein
MKSQKRHLDLVIRDAKALALFSLEGSVPRHWYDFGLCFHCASSCDHSQMFCDKCRERMGRLLSVEVPDEPA